MALLKVDTSRKKPAPFTREKSENESKNEIFLGMSGINFREQALKTLGFVAGDKIGFTPHVDAKEGETIKTTTGKVLGLYFQKENDVKLGYKLGTNNAITGTAIVPYLIELAGVGSRFSKLENSKPNDLLDITEMEEFIKGKQIVFTVAEEPIEFEDKQLYAVTFKEIVTSTRGTKGSVDETPVPLTETVEPTKESPVKKGKVSVEEDL